MFTSATPRRVAAALLATALSTSAAAGQAKIKSIVGPPEGVRVQVAGASGETPGTVGLLLQPGDLLRTDTTTDVELQCTTLGAPTYRLDGGFHGYIDVPVNDACTVAVAEGHADVIAEEPTNTIGGTTALASKGTQYAVDVSRGDSAPICNLAVYDGEVFWRKSPDTVAAQGSTMRWVGSQVTGKGGLDTAQLVKSAALYAKFDVAAAPKTDAPGAEAPSYKQLEALHYRVLSQPKDTAARVELAKEQIRYQVDAQAAYNLRRANVTNDAALRRYDIDPRIIRNRAELKKGVYQAKAVTKPVGAAAGAVAHPAAAETTTAPTPAAGATERETQLSPAVKSKAAMVGAAAAPPVDAAPAPARAARGYTAPAVAPGPAAPPPTTDSDLQLIAAGKIDEAIRNLGARVGAGTATSRDHYAFAKAYAGRDPAQVRLHAGLALRQHAADGKLSDPELQEIRALLAAAG
jgi:hypothetical protein